MHGARRMALAFLLVVVSGCDRTPTDPTLDRTSSLLDPAVRASVYAPSSTALPELFRKATTKVLLDHGRDAQRKLLRSWRNLNEQAEAALKSGDRHLAESRIAAVRSEARPELFLLPLNSHDGAEAFIEHAAGLLDAAGFTG